MTTENLSRQLKSMKKDVDDINYKKQQIITEMDSLRERVKKCAIACIICIMIQSIVLTVFRDSKSLSLAALGRFLNPIVSIILLYFAVILIVKGFDLFINTDTKLSWRLAKKLGRETAAQQIDIYNGELAKLENQISSIEYELYDNNNVSDRDLPPYYDNEHNKMVNNNKPEYQYIKNQDNEIDDILHGFDDWDDDEDEFESSSELWKKDAMNRFS